MSDAALVHDPRPARPRPRRDLSVPLVVMTLVVGALLRFAYLDSGLRQTPHMDEQYFVRNVERMLRTGSFDHGFYEYPGLLFYLLAPVLAAVGVSDPPGASAYLAARACVAGFGVLALGLAYVFGSRLLGRPAALVATGLLALSPVHVATAHMLRADVVLEALVLLAFLALLRLGTDWRDDARAGAAAGLCLGLKFSAGLLALPFLAQRLLRPGPRLRGLAVLALTAAAVFVVVSPYAVLRHAAFRAGAATQLAYHYQERDAPQAPYLARLWGYVAVWPKAVGPLGGLLALIGAGLVLSGRPRPLDAQALAAARARPLRSREPDPCGDLVFDLGRRLQERPPPRPAPRWRDLVPFLLLPPSTAAVFATTGYHFDRHMLPSLAVVALLAGFTVQVVHERAPTLGLLLGLAVLAFPLLGSLRYLEAIARPGTRERAAEWIDAHVPPGARVLSAVPQFTLDGEIFELLQQRLSGPLAGVLARSADVIVSVPKDEPAGVLEDLPPAVVIEPRSAFEGPTIAVRVVPPAERLVTEPIALAGATLRASAHPEALEALRDGRLDSFWEVDTSAGRDEWISMAWPERVRVARVELRLGLRVHDAARRLRVLISTNGENFSHVPSVGGRPSVRKQRAGDADASEVLLIAPVELRALRIERRSGARGTAIPRWSVAELSVEGTVARGQPAPKLN